MFDHLVLPLALIATAVVFVGYVIVEVARVTRRTDQPNRGDVTRLEHMLAIRDAEEAWDRDVWGSVARHPAGKKLPVIPTPRREDEL